MKTPGTPEIGVSTSQIPASMLMEEITLDLGNRQLTPEDMRAAGEAYAAWAEETLRAGTDQSGPTYVSPTWRNFGTLHNSVNLHRDAESDTIVTTFTTLEDGVLRPTQYRLTPEGYVSLTTSAQTSKPNQPLADGEELRDPGSRYMLTAPQSDMVILIGPEGVEALKVHFDSVLEAAADAPS